MKTKNIIFLIWLLLIMYLVLFLGVRTGSGQYLLLKIIFLFGALLGVVASGIVADLYGATNPHRISYMRGALAMFLVFLAELFLLIFQIGWIKQDFFIPDIFYLLSYLALFAAAYNEIKLAQIKIFSRKNFYLLGLFMATAVIIIFFEATYTLSAFNSSFTLSLIYSLLDASLLFACIVLLIIAREYKQGRLYKPWLILFLAVLCLLLSDILGMVLNAWSSGDLLIREFVYFIWLVGFLSYSWAMSHFSLILIDKREEIKNKIEVQ